MRSSLLVKLLGFPATLIHGDCLVLDRWIWLCQHLPITKNGEKLLDVGCGSGAFTIGTALRGYFSLGLSWDKRNQDAAEFRAALCNASTAKFNIQDVRMLNQRNDLKNSFDFILCCENIEHIIDDLGLMRSMTSCLKPGGRILLTAPYYNYRAITSEDNGPFSAIENGWHVRRGYTPSMLRELATCSGLLVEEISYCSGFLSQKITALYRFALHINPVLAWLIILWLRPLPILLDSLVYHLFRWPFSSICLVAYKPRFTCSQ